MTAAKPLKRAIVGAQPRALLGALCATSVPSVLNSGAFSSLRSLLASAAFRSAITAMRIAIHGRDVTMPNLTGKNVVEATSMLRSRGLVLRVADRIYSELPINVVVRQTPPAGLLMKESQQAHVVLSLGQRQLQIPLLEGNSLRASTSSSRKAPAKLPTSCLISSA